MADVRLIQKAAENSRNVVVVGSSFIGIETCFSIKDFMGEKVNVTCVSADQPFARAFGPKVGQVLQKLHEENGIKFVNNTTVENFSPSATANSQVGSVKLSNGQTIDADLVVTGVGTIPNTEYLGKEFVRTKSGHIEVSKALKTGVPNVFAAGDIISIKGTVVEHYGVAMDNGAYAAMNMMGKNARYTEVGSFWTRFWGFGVQYIGWGGAWDRVVIDGDLEGRKF